jgi:hypothetical protein
VDRKTRAGRKVRAFDHEHLQRSRLRVDARQWLMEKYAPDRFGERKKVEITTRDAEFARMESEVELVL